MQGVYFNFMSSIRVFLKRGEKMPDLNGLKSIKQLSCLNDSMLENLVTITHIISYKAGDYIFKEGDDAKRLYAVIDGKVGLEIEKNSSTRILIDNITQGMMLGFSDCQNKVANQKRSISVYIQVDDSVPLIYIIETDNALWALYFFHRSVSSLYSVPK
jgi:CRP-like cAMP-binding protein